MSKPSIFAAEIFAAWLYDFDMKIVTDREMRDFFTSPTAPCVLTASQFASGKRFLRLNPSARLGFSYVSDHKGWSLTTDAERIDEHHAHYSEVCKNRLANVYAECKSLPA